MFDDVDLVHQALPGLSFEEIDISTNFLGKKISAPIVISGMTGGTEELGRLNSIIATAAEKTGIAMGVGSQRVALERSETRESFAVVRRIARDIPVIANIGAPQLLRGYGVRELEEAISMVEADAIAVHFNPAQEVFQPEGEPDYSDRLLTVLSEVIKSLGVPVIVKETGTGLAMETVSKLRRVGVTHFDVQGAGGTSWVAVEMFRGRRRGNWKWRSADVFKGWGVPTAASIIETRFAAPDSFIIGSGGIRNGLDGAKALALGADLVGMALPAMRAAVKGAEALGEFVEDFKFQLKVASFLVGAKDVRDIKKTPLVISGKLRDWVTSRGLDLSVYTKVRAGRA
ncbi:type 2 isopentenyl-diphosphate Delta-isomerase [Sulfodiicoccus acidiphilus]|uniref:Isopentenyl-diphosphate delta-isomerase n=2 Tax=Sulfodiicoccus acidiphilus TaxID=1670455 RepID=A0A348B6V7_9CREN|nr:type 2 isopentenyl-diphosphate Delta-isomerase [Sulfodiicoccus acidiphilus]GGT95940.1 type 2 isopentenyl-diphosphate Delta-isomerase [Sulfodiicoccus acidiphilus]